MGYATNIIISIPMAIIIYLLTDKMISSFTSENKFNDRVQKNFVLGFIVGMALIALGMTVFAKGSNMENQAIQFALYLAGGFIVLNAVFFNWDSLDESTKIIVLGIGIAGLAIYTYRNKD